MRTVEKAQIRLGQLRIEDIKLDAKSRDDLTSTVLDCNHMILKDSHFQLA